MIVAYGYYGMRGLYFDKTMILVLIGMVLSLAASAMVKGTFAKYKNLRAQRGITGAEAAEKILRQAGINNVSIHHISGELTDHYDPSRKTLSLSDSVYNSSSVAAISVAAHECGHAIQDANAYAPLKIRGAMVPVVNIGSTISWPLIIIGMFMGSNSILIQIGILMFSAVVLFHLVTLPVEFNASRRALKIMESSGILYNEENAAAKKVLTAAAMTYVASAAAMILQLLRLIILTRGRRND